MLKSSFKCLILLFFLPLPCEDAAVNLFTCRKPETVEPKRQEEPVKFLISPSSYSCALFLCPGVCGT